MKKKINVTNPDKLHKKRKFLYDTTFNYRNKFLDKQKKNINLNFLKLENVQFVHLLKIEKFLIKKAQVLLYAIIVKWFI